MSEIFLNALLPMIMPWILPTEKCKQDYRIKLNFLVICWFYHICSESNNSFYHFFFFYIGKTKEIIPHFAGENESRSVLDAFFLGKALAEALNERIESTLGEFISTIGRLQAEQQKQVQEFQVLILGMGLSTYD